MFVGFDLDMTLLDTRPGIAATYRALSARTGTHIDADLVITRLGPPLEVELARWFPVDEVPEVVVTYRGLYREHGILPSQPLPGARDAVAAVHAAGGRVLVVTAKHAPLALLHLDHLGFAVDEVVGDVWGEGKTAVIGGALAYVGDHETDMRAARAAEITAIGVATGPCDADELWAAGADHVLADLRDFPDVLARLERTRIGD